LLRRSSGRSSGHPQAAQGLSQAGTVDADLPNTEPDPVFWRHQDRFVASNDSVKLLITALPPGRSRNNRTFLPGTNVINIDAIFRRNRSGVPLLIHVCNGLIEAAAMRKIISSKPVHRLTVRFRLKVYFTSSFVRS
jgi:hypothetical protein